MNSSTIRQVWTILIPHLVVKITVYGLILFLAYFWFIILDVHPAGHLLGPAPTAHWRVPSLHAQGEELRRKDEQNVSRWLVRIWSIVQFCLSQVFESCATVVWRCDWRRRWVAAQRTVATSDERFHGWSQAAVVAADHQVHFLFFWPHLPSPEFQWFGSMYGELTLAVPSHLKGSAITNTGYNYRL